MQYLWTLIENIGDAVGEGKETEKRGLVVAPSLFFWPYSYNAYQLRIF